MIQNNRSNQKSHQRENSCPFSPVWKLLGVETTSNQRQFCLGITNPLQMVAAALEPPEVTPLQQGQPLGQEYRKADGKLVHLRWTKAVCKEHRAFSSQASAVTQTSIQPALLFRPQSIMPSKSKLAPGSVKLRCTQNPYILTTELEVVVLSSGCDLTTHTWLF